MGGLLVAGDAIFGTLQKLLPALDLAAAAVFALTGALVASRKQIDIVDFDAVDDGADIGLAERDFA